jgi:hypothetical protein
MKTIALSMRDRNKLSRKAIGTKNNGIYSFPRITVILERKISKPIESRLNNFLNFDCAHEINFKDMDSNFKYFIVEVC